MIAIVSNLKFCYKFFQEENFAALSDCQFHRFERSLEATEQLIELKQREIMFLLQSRNGKVETLNRALEGLKKLTKLVNQFWESSLEQDFHDELEQAVKSLVGLNSPFTRAA